MPIPTPSALQRLTSWVRVIVAANCPTINTVAVGYIWEVASGQVTYDVMMITPPKATIPEPRNWNRKSYALHYFLIRQDVGASGDTMTPLEREAAWGSLESLNKTFVQALMGDPSNYQVTSEVAVDPNSGGGDQLLPDAVIWIECTLTLLMNDC